MAFQKVTYDPKRQDQLTVNADIDEQGNVTTVTYQRIQFLVCVSDTGSKPTITSALAADDGTTAVPTAGLKYTIEGQGGYSCKQVYPKRSNESPCVIEVQITYEAKFAVQPKDQDKWNIKLSLSGSKTTEPAYEGKNHGTGAVEAVTNSALQSFDPPPSKTYYLEQVTVSYKTTSPPDFAALRGRVNSDAVSFTIKGVSRSYSPNQLLLDDYNLSTTVTLSDATTEVWDVSCTLLGLSGSASDGSPLTFTRKILDEGYCILDSNKKLVVLLDKSNQPLNCPALLDGSGNQLPAGGTPVYRQYDIEDAAALSSVFDGLA